MTATVSDTEHGLVRVFFVSRPQDLRRGETLTLDQIEDSLGVSELNAEDIQQVWTRDLDDMTMTDFLRTAYEVRDDDLAPHVDALNAAGEVDAIFVLIRSGAFPNRPVTLEYQGLLVHMATLREPDGTVTFDPLPNPDPQGVVADPPQKKPPSDAAMSGRIAMVALLVMALLVWLMIWVAG